MAWVSVVLAGLIAFLWKRNESLHGRLTPVISGVLVWCMIGAIVAVFWLTGWKTGLATIVMCFCVAAFL